MKNPNLPAVETAREELEELTVKVKKDGESFERGESTKEALEQFDTDIARIEELKNIVAVAERAEQAKKLEISRSLDRPNQAPSIRVKRKADKRDYNNALKAWILGADRTRDQVNDELKRSCDLLDTDYTKSEFICRAQSVDAGGEGDDFLHGSQYSGLVEAKEYVGNIISYCDVVNTAKGGPIHFAIADDTAAVTAIKAENVSVANTSIATDKVTLDNFSYSSGVFPVSLQLVEDSQTDIVSWVQSNLMRRYVRKMVSEVTNGVGTTTATGFTVGVTAEGASTAAFDDLDPSDFYDLYFSVDKEYRDSSKCCWVMNDSVLAQMMEDFQSTDLKPIWGNGLNGAPELSLMGKPIVVNNYLEDPALDTPIVYFGDFSHHKVRTVGAPRLIRDDSRLIDTLSVYLAVWGRFDSIYVNPGNDPIKLMQTLAS